MAGFSSPLRLVPPLTPRRALSPTMSPGRRSRLNGIFEESHLRDLSPDTTLRAFTQIPLPYDTSLDEYKIFSCVNCLTVAERDLGMRVAKAAQRLKSWCAEIEQWGWSGSFEEPSATVQKQQRKDLEMRIREHVPDADVAKSLGPLEYWGSLLSDEVKQHEARLDDIEDEMIRLDVEELKEYVLDMHPGGRSRPSSAGYEASRHNYKPIDDFSFLITQTLLSALPYHAQLKDRLHTWTARVTVLREAPRYIHELDDAKKAMRLGWDAIEPPTDTSDNAFLQWRDAVAMISHVLQSKVGNLGRQLDKMLDTLEGREDCLPDCWIDIFECIETDHGHWAQDSRRRVIELDVRRRIEGRTERQQRKEEVPEARSSSDSDSDSNAVQSTMSEESGATAEQNQIRNSAATSLCYRAIYPELPDELRYAPQEASSQLGSSPSTVRESTPLASPGRRFADVQPNVTPATSPISKSHTPSSTRGRGIFARGLYSPDPTSATITPTTTEHPRAPSPESPLFGRSTDGTSIIATSIPEKTMHSVRNSDTMSIPPMAKNSEQLERPSPLLSKSVASFPSQGNHISQSAMNENEQSFVFEPETSLFQDESFFEEGETVVHNDVVEEDIDGDSELTQAAQSTPGQDAVKPSNGTPNHLDITYSAPGARLDFGTKDMKIETTNTTLQFSKKPIMFTNSPTIVTTDGHDRTVLNPPRTPPSRRGSAESLASDMSFETSPHNFIEDSPTVRKGPARGPVAPRPELNAAMTKRRAAKIMTDDVVASTPWPPTQFAQQPANSTEDLEQKISDILNTIPTHIRLTTGPGVDAPEVKPRHGIVHKSSKVFLRAGRSASGLKSPELILSPAKHDLDAIVSGRKSSAAFRADNDIKLYHLTQPGKEHPIKLFIRRVGENGERVMVRVGGGWADLGEYLRQYAEHHGRRTVSDGKFEILGLEVKNPDSPGRSESAIHKRDRGLSAVTNPLTTPSKPAPSLSPATDGAPPTPNFGISPNLPEEPSIPSTNSSQRSWLGNEVGLAGPKSRRLDLSGEKLEWVEGMMKQARTVSGSVIPPAHEKGEGRSDSRSESRGGMRASRKSDFGDLGKVGGTKRIFLRGGQPTEH